MPGSTPEEFLPAPPARRDDVPPPEPERQPAAPPEGRRPLPHWLRALRAVGIFFVVVVAQAVAPAVFWLTGLADTAPGAMPPAWFMAASFPLPILATILAWRFIVRETQRQLGHVGPPLSAVKAWLAGSLVGAVPMGLIALAGALAGIYVFHRIAVEAGPVWAWTLVLIPAAYFEEVLIRGFLLQEVLGRWSAMAGVIFSSLVFALMHAANPDVFDMGPTWAVVIGLNIFLAGVTLGLVFVRTGNLWLVSGLHFGWNWLQAIGLGLPVSGMDMPGLLGADVEPGLLGGSSFGPESSLLATAVLVVMVAVLLVTHRRNPLPVPAEQTPDMIRRVTEPAP